MKKDDILIVGAVAMAAWMMLRGKGATAAPRPITVAQPGGGTVGNLSPLTSIADYILRGIRPGTALTPYFGSNYSGVAGVIPGSQQDVQLASQWNDSFGWNNLSGVAGVDYGSVQDQMLAQQWS
jgi:hypothetical protein